jgi:pimeloyl-ACP methyl ester carboxylesterase
MVDSSQVVRLAHASVGSGPPLMLVAGTGYPGVTWPPELVERLAERCTVITFDHRGTGDSPVTDDRYSTRLFAADAIRLLDELGIEAAHVLGHSMGGRVAQWMALDAPERVQSLVMAASGPGQFDPSRPVTRGVPLPTAAKLADHGYRGYLERHITVTFFTPEFASQHPNRVAWLIDAFWSKRPDIESYLRHVIARQEHDTTELLHRITQPTLVLVGSRDTHQGGTGSHWDQSRYLVEHLPDAHFEVIEGAAHGYFWSHPEQTVRALTGWIDRNR